MSKRVKESFQELVKNREFVDRDEARDKFWQCYNEVCMNFGQNFVKVLTFYGIGGIGKSELCKKIVEEIEDHVHDIKYLSINLENVDGEKDILYKMKNQLSWKYKFSFDLFEYALYNFEIKCGKDSNKPEVKSVIEDSNFLSTIFDVADAISIFSPASSIIKAIDSTLVCGKNYVKNIQKEEKEKLQEIEGKSAEELNKDLLKYFIIDLRRNMIDEELPLVIIFDTYEKLVNELNCIGHSFDNDLWLRGNSGLVVNCPNILWVFAGREKLKWTDYDSDWDEECLEQYLVEGLSDEDAKFF